jgi:Domain of unknown function (DU1801)
MASNKPKTGAQTAKPDTSAAVDEFMSQLDHPFKSEIQAIRTAILAVSSAVTEGIKWNAPSYRTTEYFATTNLREKNGVGIILHLGAKVRDLGPEGISIQDSDGLLKWLAKDRAMVVFKDMSDFNAKKLAFTKVLKQWLKYV